MASVVIRSAATEAAFWIATRVDDALGDQVDVFTSLAIKAIGVLILLENLADDDGAVLARIDRDLARGHGERFAWNLPSLRDFVHRGNANPSKSLFSHRSVSARLT